MKRVVVDARMVGPIGHGIARYVELMAKGLLERQHETGLGYELIFLVRPGQRIEGFQCEEVSAAFLSPVEVSAIPLKLRSLRASLYHSPSFSSLIRSPCPYVVTVHDLIHLDYGEWKEKLYYRSLLKRFIRKARCVMTVSEYSRARIADWARIVPSRIEVVHNAIEPVARSADGAIENVIKSYGLDRGRYFLCLSNSKPHKNVSTLLSAYEWYRRETGAFAWPLVLSTELESPPPGVRSLGQLSNEDAGALLEGAGTLVFPSLEEGFGRPPLEAAVAGVPIAVSQIAPHQEALVDAPPDEVLFVPPLDRGGWSRALRSASDGRIRAPSERTRARILERYSTRGLGARMDRIYRRVLGLDVG